jgi:alkylation response protein AidB-like acyl-CoA dehydrogenase
MSPIRHEDDFRRVEIDDWDEYVQEEIQGAIERGEMENLPDKGKPIKIWRTEINPEYDLAFSRLKNAGVLPTWMELDAEIARTAREMEAFLTSSREYVRRHLDELREMQARRDRKDAPAYPRWHIWRRIADWWRLDLGEPNEPPAAGSVSDLIVHRDRMRNQYLTRAAEMDKKISEYHNALPRELSHLQRLRMLPDRAARLFDEAVPIRMLVDDESG